MMRIFIGLLLLFTALHAAEPTGTLAGTVTDPTGAVIAGAKVVATNTQTGLTREMQTGTAGGFVFPLLPVGAYRLGVEAAGFGNYQQTGVQLATDQSVTVQIRLKIGTASESVEVTASPQMVEARS